MDTILELVKRIDALNRAALFGKDTEKIINSLNTLMVYARTIIGEQGPQLQFGGEVQSRIHASLILPAIHQLNNADLDVRRVSKKCAAAMDFRMPNFESGKTNEKASLGEIEENKLACLGILKLVVSESACEIALNDKEKTISIGHLISVILGCAVDESSTGGNPSKNIIRESLEVLALVLRKTKADTLCNFLPGIVSKLLKLNDGNTCQDTRSREALFESLSATIRNCLDHEDVANFKDIISILQSKQDKADSPENYVEKVQKVLQTSRNEADLKEVSTRQPSKEEPSSESPRFVSRLRNLEWLEQARRLNDVMRLFFKISAVYDSFDLSTRIIEKKSQCALEILGELLWYGDYFRVAIFDLMDYIVASMPEQIGISKSIFREHAHFQALLEAHLVELIDTTVSNGHEFSMKELRLQLLLLAGYIRFVGQLEKGAEVLSSVSGDIRSLFELIFELMEDEDGSALLLTGSSLKYNVVDYNPKQMTSRDIKEIPSDERVYFTPFQHTSQHGRGRKSESIKNIDEYSSAIYENICALLRDGIKGRNARTTILDHVLGLCEAIGYAFEPSVSIGYIETFNQLYYSNERPIHVVGILLSIIVFKGVSMKKKVSNNEEDDIIEGASSISLVAQSVSATPIHPWEYAEVISKSVFESLYEFLKELGQDLELRTEDSLRKLECLFALSVGSTILGPMFNSLHPFVLFPVLESLGQVDDLVRVSSLSCLLSVSKHCGYDSIGLMLLGNADYIVDSISHRFRRITRYPHVLKILEAVLKYAGPDILDFIGDILDDILSSLDQNHLPGHVLDFFTILLEVVETSHDSLLRGELKAFVDEMSSKSHYMKAFISEADDTVNDDSRDKDIPSDEIETLEEIDNQNESIDSHEDDNEEDRWRSIQEIRIIERIMEKCVHFLSYSSINLRMTILKLIRVGSEALLPCRIILYPLLHLLWPGITKRLSDSEYSVISETISLLQFLAERCTSFLFHRYATGILPIACATLKATVSRKIDSWRSIGVVESLGKIHSNPSLRLVWDILQFMEKSARIFPFNEEAHDEVMMAMATSLSHVSLYETVLPAEFMVSCDTICAILADKYTGNGRTRFQQNCSNKK